jgi:hypothetical protein
MTRLARSRAIYLASALLTIVTGLSVHRSSGVFHPRLQDLLGDALWATMMAWLVSVAVPGARRRARAATALVICFAVELSQLIDTPALNRLRDTMIGQLVLGSGFDPRDLGAYTVGVVLALLLDRALSPLTGPAA